MNPTVNAENEAEAVKNCLAVYGWIPDAVREVDSGEEGTTAYMCFWSARDAELWDAQK